MRERDEIEFDIAFARSLHIDYNPFPLGQTDTGKLMAARLMDKERERINRTFHRINREIRRLEGCPGCQEIRDSWRIADQWCRNAAEENARAADWRRWAWIWGAVAAVELGILVVLAMALREYIR